MAFIENRCKLNKKNEQKPLEQTKEYRKQSNSPKTKEILRTREFDTYGQLQDNYDRKRRKKKL